MSMSHSAGHSLRVQSVKLSTEIHAVGDLSILGHKSTTVKSQVQSDQYFTLFNLTPCQSPFCPGVCESFPQHILISGCYRISNKPAILLLYQDSDKWLKSRNFILLPLYLLVKRHESKKKYGTVSLLWQRWRINVKASFIHYMKKSHVNEIPFPFISP